MLSLMLSLALALDVVWVIRGRGSDVFFARVSLLG